MIEAASPGSYDILTHPLTLLLATVLIGLLGYMLKWLRDIDKDGGKNATMLESLTATQKEIQQLIEHVINRQDKQDEKLFVLHENYSNLKTEHDYIKAQCQKKTT